MKEARYHWHYFIIFLGNYTADMEILTRGRVVLGFIIPSGYLQKSHLGRPGHNLYLPSQRYHGLVRDVTAPVRVHTSLRECILVNTCRIEQCRRLRSHSFCFSSIHISFSYILFSPKKKTCFTSVNSVGICKHKY